MPHNFPHDDLEPGLDETAFYDPKNFTFPSGAYIAEVEIDPDTGTLEICNFTASDDFGRIINPMIVAGQVHGGLAQGIGQALLEACVYDKATGQLLTGVVQRLHDAAGGRPAVLRAVDACDACARTTRSGSKAAARPGRSARRRRSPTPSSMR